DAMIRAVHRAGINTDGKYYTGIGKYTDPTVWCSTADDVKTALKAKPHLNAHGPGVSHKGIEAPPPKPAPLAPDIVKRETDALIRRDRKVREQLAKGKVKRKDIEARIISKHGKKRP